MKCKCEHEMVVVYVYDNGVTMEPGHAYNLYACDRCGILCKNDVWSDKGFRWIHLDGKVEE